MKPNSGTKILHNRRGHHTGFHLLIFCLNSLRLEEFLISTGTNCHVFGPPFGLRSPINCSIISRFPYFFCSKRVSGNLFL